VLLVGLVWLVVSAAFMLTATPVSAQEATSDKAGVIQRGGDDEQEQQQQGEQQQQEEAQPQPTQQQQGGQQPGAQRQGAQQQGDQQGSPESQGEVITPDNANPNEQYNLPPNFDPNYRPRRTPSNTKVTIDFREANLEEVVKFFSGAMELNFIIADSIQANKTITIISPKDVTLDQAYRAFLAALEMNGLTIVRMGEFLKIVQSKQAISEPQPTYGEGETLPNEARMVTAILPVEKADVEKIKSIIGNFTSPAATVVTYQNNLIISENASNLKRIRNLISRIDTSEAGEQVFVYDVRYADATKITDKLNELFNQQGRRGGQQGNQEAAGEGFDVDVSQLIADERTNQLIIVTDKRSFDKIKDMIKLLDKPTQVGGQVHVKFLDYADADELSSTLSSLVSAAQQGNERGGGGGRRAPPAEGGEVAAMLSGEVQITSYKPNNALVIVASPKDYVAVEHVIDKLDRPRKQVYVEAVIMELSLDTNRELGIGYSAGLGQDFSGLVPESAVEQGLIDDTQGLAVGQSNFQGLSSLGNALQGTGGSLGFLGPILSVPGTNIQLPAFALLLKATQTDDRVNILSTPSIMTLDNEEAEITVGQRVPFLQGLGGGAGGGGLGGLGGLLGQATGQQGQQGGGGLGGLGALGGLGGLVSPIEYKDVGLTLRIKPQVNDSRYVRLEVEQEVSDIASAGSDQLTPTTSERNAQTVVLAKDQSTIVIGGLMRDRKVETVQKVPFLGDIPLIGALFRKNTTITTKQNLILMLTPYIIESEADIRKIHDRKMEQRRELLKILAQEKEGYEAAINYQKKSGLVGRMRDTLSTAIEEMEAREAAREAFDEEGPRYRILGDDSGDGGDGNSESNGTNQDNGGSGNQ
jgi:general secretion pathway protein D